MIELESTSAVAAIRDPQIEQDLVGACLTTPAALDAALDEGLGAAHFYSPTWGATFGVIAAMHGAGKPVDGRTAFEEITRLGLAEPTAAQLTGSVAGVLSLGSARSYARTIIDHARRRSILAAVTEATEAARGPGSADEVGAKVDALVTAALAGDGTQASSEEVGSVVDRVVERMRLGLLDGLSSGFRDIDRLLGGGFDNGSLVVIGARPSMGKTALALGIARRTADAGRRTLFVSVEQSAEELSTRLIAETARISSTRLRAPVALRELEQVGLAASALADLPLVISDAASTLPAVAHEARRLARTPGGLALVVVDYLQLMVAPQGERREREVAELSRGLKLLARDLGVVVIVCSQLNRSAEARSDKRPMLSDLRESGAIEQDADVVMLLYRDEQYDEESDERGVAEVHIAKNRNGPTGLVKLGFLSERTAFVDLMSEHSW